MSELGPRARTRLELAFEEEIGDHFHGMIMRLSGDDWGIDNIVRYGDQFEKGLLAIKTAREVALARSDKVFQ